LGIFVKANRQGLGGASALALTLALASVPGSAWAQAQTQAPAALEEIVVTAERRETNLQDTPVAVTAITGDTLRALGAATIEDLQVFTPGITITNDSMAIINIRGIGTSAFGVATDPSSTVHYDGVYIPRPTTSYQDMFDVERIELLRGPQGVLFGRNSAGGTLNITSQAPTATLQGVVSATLGNYDRRTFSGTVSGPLGERVRGRLTVMKNDRDGIYSNPKTGEDYQNINRAAVRGTLWCCAPTTAATARPAIPRCAPAIRPPSPWRARPSRAAATS
jgi:iron complex outermembrane recepter protein